MAGPEGSMAKGGPKVLNPEKFVDQLESIWASKTKYTEHRKKSTEFMKEFFSSSSLVPNLMEKIIS